MSDQETAMPAGYSGTPLPRKLGITQGARVVLLRAPREFREVLGDLPPGVHVSTRTPRTRTAAVAVLFARARASLESAFASAARGLQPAGGLWVAWPKKTSGVRTDLTENLVREIGLGAGLVDNKVCAIDERWSGLRFVYRIKDRPGL